MSIPVAFAFVFGWLVLGLVIAALLGRCAKVLR